MHTQSFNLALLLATSSQGHHPPMQCHYCSHSYQTLRTRSAPLLPWWWSHWRPQRCLCPHSPGLSDSSRTYPSRCSTEECSNPLAYGSEPWAFGIEWLRLGTSRAGCGSEAACYEIVRGVTWQSCKQWHRHFRSAVRAYDLVCTLWLCQCLSPQCWHQHFIWFKRHVFWVQGCF